MTLRLYDVSDLEGLLLPSGGTTLDVPIKQSDGSVVWGAQTGGGGGGADASTTVKGISKLSVAPVSSTSPIAAGDNDTRLSDTRTPTDGSVTNAKVDAAAAIAESKLNLASDAAAGTASRRTLGTTSTSAAAGNDARIPTQGENDAGQGTNGTPSNTNRYVTDSDARNTNTRTPTDATVTLPKAASGVGFESIGTSAPGTPQTGQIWYDSTNNRIYENIGTSGSPVWRQIDGPLTFAWSLATIVTGAIPYRMYFDRNITILRTRITIGTGLSSGTLTVDLEKAPSHTSNTFTTLYSTTGNRPSIAATGTYGATNAAAPNTVDITAGEHLRPNVISAGVGGANLAVAMDYYVRQ